MLNLKDLPEVLKTSEVASYLRLSIQTIRRLIKKGNFIPCSVFNSRGDKRFLKSEVIKYVENKEALSKRLIVPYK